MNIRAHVPIDKAAFFAFLCQQAEGRFEYDRGLIVQQMTGGTGRHTIVAKRVADCLAAQLDATLWLVSGHVRGVETSETVRYPDVVVEPAAIDLDSLATSEPVLLAEVLSPSTRALDLSTKPAEYTSLASLAAYIAVEQDQARCYIWLRDVGGGFPAAPVEIDGIASLIEIATLGVSIPLETIYRGLL